MNRDKFLVEVGEKGIWHEWKYLSIKSHAFQVFPCICGANHSIIPNSDFSKPENFIRLLEIAEKKGMGIKIDIGSKTICIRESYESGIFSVGISWKSINQIKYSNISDIPPITADLIAKALGWKGE